MSDSFICQYVKGEYFYNSRRFSGQIANLIRDFKRQSLSFPLLSHGNFTSVFFSGAPLSGPFPGTLPSLPRLVPHFSMPDNHLSPPILDTVLHRSSLTLTATYYISVWCVKVWNCLCLLLNLFYAIFMPSLMSVLAPPPHIIRTNQSFPPLLPEPPPPPTFRNLDPFTPNPSSLMSIMPCPSFPEGQ